MTEGRERDRAAIIAPPPVLVVVCVVGAIVVDHFRPLPIVRSEWPRFVVGTIMLAIGFVIGFTAIRQFHAHHEQPNPYTPTNAIIDTGIYSRTRNPIYVSFFVIVVSAAFFANSWWVVIAEIPLFFLLRFGVIAAEERYLATKFGAPYEDYRRRVRRWI